jgi:predicted RNase H-like nuclease (RuvC/YqgF family)
MERRVHKEQFYDGEIIVTRWVVEGFANDRWVDLPNGGPFHTEDEATEAMNEMASGVAKKKAKKPSEDAEMARLREENETLKRELDEKHEKDSELNRLRKTNADLKERQRNELKSKAMRRNIRRKKNGTLTIAGGDENE